MGSISQLTPQTASRIDFNIDFSSPSLLNSRTVSANRHDFSHEQRICSDASQSCYNRMLEIPKIAGNFLVHRYADARMFTRSFCSMFGSTTTSEIDRRVNEIRQFRILMEDSQVTGQRANRRFERLTPQTQGLFFYTNASYMAQFQNETDPAKAGAIRFEILRECNQAISFQRTLSAVNTFFRVFTGRISSGTSESSHLGAPEERSGFGALWGRLFGRGEILSHGEDGGRSEPMGAVGVPRRPIPGVDLNIPGTVPYVRDAIPAAVEAKATQINTLLESFHGAIPDAFKDPVTLDFMTIPVFDASHPAVQSGLPALRTALTGGSGVTILNSHRTARHTLEKDSLEGHIATSTSWAPAKCILCRHPENGGIRREALRIDTGLQDEILQFLRGAVPAGA